MNKEVPVNKKCCLGLPLRCSLVTWGYFKLVASAFFITVISYALLHTLVIYKLYGRKEIQRRVDAELVITIIALALFVADFLATIMFVAGKQRMKKIKRIRAFYYFSIVTWVLAMLLTAMAVSLSVESLFSRYMTLRSSVVNLSNFASYFVTIVVQTYFLVLLRSEIIKLSAENCEFRFVNNTAEAECTMTCKDEVAGDDTDTDTEVV